MHWINRTPFPGAAFMDVDPEGRDTLVAVVKATYDIDASGQVSVSAAQRRLQFSDVYAGEPGASSLLHESDANWGRTGTDVSFVAYAHPLRQGDVETLVAARVGNLVQTAQVWGDRQWSTHLGIARVGDPKPIDRIPLIYERAFGGVDHTPADPKDHADEPRNPVGRGFRARRSQAPVEGSPLPNVECAERPIRHADDRAEPVGFTCVARSWRPRQQFAGTYDAAWQSGRMPLLPTDFDRRYFAAASPGLHAVEPLRGGEPVVLQNMTPNGRLELTLPVVPLHGAFGVDARVSDLQFRMSAVVIDTLRMELVVSWHASHPAHRLVDAIDWVTATSERSEVQAA